MIFSSNIGSNEVPAARRAAIRTILTIQLFSVVHGNVRVEESIWRPALERSRHHREKTPITINPASIKSVQIAVQIWSVYEPARERSELPEIAPATLSVVEERCHCILRPLWKAADLRSGNFSSSAAMSMSRRRSGKINAGERREAQSVDRHSALSVSSALMNARFLHRAQTDSISCF